MILTEEEQEKRLRKFKRYKNAPKEGSIHWACEKLLVAETTLWNWVNDFGIPITKTLILKKNRLRVSEENLESFRIIKDLLYIEGYTVKGAKRQLELRGLMDNKHFLKS